MKESVNRYELPKISEVMTKKVVAFPLSFTTIDALKAFNSHRISSAPVMGKDDENEVVGIISDEDCMNAIANYSFFDDFRNPSIESAMTKAVKSLDPDINIYQAESFFRQNHLKHVPVINDQGKLVGMLSRRDIMMALEKIVDKIQLHKEKVKKTVILTDMEKLRLSVRWRSKL